ncbi:MAG: ferrochelatase, partial [Thermoguttaceae bacterium]
HRNDVRLIFTAHSIPTAMAEQSPYVAQLREACALVVDRLRERGLGASVPNAWELAFQSRSGPTQQPWLGPDIQDRLGQLHQAGVGSVVIAPIGFLLDCMETVYDLDVEAAERCDELGIHMVRAPAVGSHPRLVRMIRELICERLDPASPRLALGSLGPWPDECPADCCMNATSEARADR